MKLGYKIMERLGLANRGKSDRFDLRLQALGSPWAAGKASGIVFRSRPTRRAA